MTLKIGWDSQDITPDKPVELIGQYYQRISKGVRDPLAVTALAMEHQADGKTVQCVLVSVDILYVTEDFMAEVRAAISQALPNLNPKAILLNATHIHTGASWFAPFRWWKPAAQAMESAEIRALILRRAVRAIENAWNNRRSGGTSYAAADASVGFSRRTLYADGSAMMYGRPDREDFVGMESSSDPTVRMLFTWDDQDRLTGIIVNVACPAQVMEAQYTVSADYFGELRKRIRATHGSQVQVLAQLSAAGDQSPRHLPTQAKQEVNYWDESGMLAIAGRLERAVAEGFASARGRIGHTPVLQHSVAPLSLPMRRVATEEYRTARAAVAKLTEGFPSEDAASREFFERFVADVHTGEKSLSHGPFDNKELNFVQLENAQALIERFETQEQCPTLTMELHALRVGECVFVFNPFELYLDFGLIIHARSCAKHTFLVQLACDVCGYLPTARSEKTGGYGSLIINGKVGSEGGRMLVEASLNAIEQLWRN